MTKFSNKKEEKMWKIPKWNMNIKRMSEENKIETE